MGGTSIDMSTIAAASSSSSSAGSNANNDQAATKTVERKRRISYESYPDLNIADIINNITLEDLLLEDYLTDDDDYAADWEDDHRALGQ